MKKWIHAATKTRIRKFRNRRNPNKFLEVHEDGYGHRSARQYMEWEETGVKNPTGDGSLHRWRKDNMDELFDDYEEIESSSDFAGPYIDDSNAYFEPDRPDDEPDHLYVVSLWHEIDPGHDTLGPEAAQEIINVGADTEEDAIETAISFLETRLGIGAVERAEVLAIDPEDVEEDLPFDASTDVYASEIVDNGQIQKGLVYYSDGFTHEIIDVSPDHKTCTERETWINEDTGEEMENITKCKIAQDENGNEFFYDPEYEEYAFNPDGYSWWARKYATGADNYPFDWTRLE